MGRTLVALLALVVGVAVGGAGCAHPGADPDDSETGGSDQGGEVDTPDPDGPFAWARCGEARHPLPPLVEDRRVYEQDPLEVWPIELTIADLDALAAVDAGDAEARVPVFFRQGDFGADATGPNAILKLRGESSRFAREKSYKLELVPEVPRWRGQREINLNKHFWDVTRLRNKLGFDLFRAVPHLTSMRTQFVHLTINGADRGLYTWVEEGDRKFLARHGLDPDGQLYKASSFRFQDLAPDVLADPERLRAHLEPKANADDPGKLARMLAALHDEAIDVDALIATYFERDNLVTWLAVNALLNNIDTYAHNYYLYSPSSCDGWYFLPWDYDGAFGYYGQLGRVDDRKRWQRGLSAWWPSALWRRFFSKRENVDAVRARMVELAGGALSDERIAAQLARYHDLVRGFVTAAPDVRTLPGGGGTAAGALAVWEGELTRISSTVTRFAAEYDAVLERPMPIYQSASLGPTVTLRWGASFDLQHDPLTYDVEVATSPRFAAGELIAAQRGLTGLSTTMPAPAAGTYHWRVIVRDGKTPDSYQLPFDPSAMLVVP